MVLETVNFLGPKRMLMRLVEIEQAGVKDRLRRDTAEIGLDQPGIRIQGTNDLARLIQPHRPGFRHLVQDDHIGELHLVDQQVDHGLPVRLSVQPHNVFVFKDAANTVVKTSFGGRA